MFYLEKEGKIRYGDIAEVGCFVQCGNTLAAGKGIARIVYLA
jgi:hypothetical protein